MGCNCSGGEPAKPPADVAPRGLAFELVTADGTQRFARLADARTAKADQIGVIRPVRA